MAPFYEELCQGLWVREAFECAPPLVGVNVVRPVGRSTLTPPARRRCVAAVPGPGGSWRARPGVASRVRVREVAGPKSRCPGSGRPRWISESSPSALPCPPDLVLLLAVRRRRRRAGGRPRRTGAGAGTAWPPWRSWTAAACAGSRPGRGCRGGAGDAGHAGHVVEPAVAGAGQAVAGVLSAGGIDRRGAGRGGKVVAVGEPGHVSRVGQDPGGAGGADSVDVHQV